MKYVLLNSGGSESRLAAIFLSRMKAEGDEIHSLYIDFGLPNRESAMAAAQETAELYCETHAVMKCQIDIDGIKWSPAYYDSDNKEFIPVEQLSEQEKERLPLLRINAYPYLRKKILLEAMGYARNIINADMVVTGHNLGAGQEWLDKWHDVMNSYNSIYDSKKVTVWCPFIGKKTADILKELELTAEAIEGTVSCSQEFPCGVCHACIKRAELADDGEESDEAAE